MRESTAAVGLNALWFGLLGAPLAWTAQALVDYALVAHSCFPETVIRRAPLLEPLGAVVATVSALALIVAVLALLTALRSWRRAGGHFGDERASLTEAAPPVGRVRFMAMAGILVSALLLLGIVLHGAGVLLLAPCT